MYHRVYHRVRRVYHRVRPPSEEACIKFAESVSTHASVGPLLNLARCHEKAGRTATAFSEYSQAARLAQEAGQKDRATTASELAAALVPKLSRLAIMPTMPLEGMRILRDGAEFEDAGWGVAQPVDPGEHHIEVSAPGYQTWSTSVSVGADRDQKAVVVPALVRVDSTEVKTPFDHIPKNLEPAGTALATVALVIEPTGLPGLVITVDGRRHQGGALRLAAGRHTISASADGYLPRVEEVVVNPGERRQLSLALIRRADKREPPAKRPRRAADGSDAGYVGGAIASFVASAAAFTSATLVLEVVEQSTLQTDTLVGAVALYGGALGLGMLGVVLLVPAVDDDDEHQAGSRVLLAPVVGSGVAAMSATWSF